MKLILVVLLPLLLTIQTPSIVNGCIEVERDALLTFKAGLDDPGNIMSSWHGQDCCNWSGVTCDDIITEHVVKLNLTNPSGSIDYSYALTGEINPSLLSLQQLNHLDLSNNNFSNLNVPKFIGSFENLVYLDLSGSDFIGVIPYELGNLSRLQFLDLSYCQFSGIIPPQLGNLSDLLYLSLSNFYAFPVLSIGTLSWFHQLYNLRYFDMSGVNLNNVGFDWPAINKLHLLETLILSQCYLSEIPIDQFHVNSTSLTKLDLSNNEFSVTLPNWLWNLTSLLYLDLNDCGFTGTIPHALRNLALLNYLSIGANDFDHIVDLEPISRLHNLRSLKLGFLKISGDIESLIISLGRTWYNLEIVNLGYNNISGPISNWIEDMNNLSYLDLSSNLLTGHIPSEIGTLSQLRGLYLSDNSLSGVITDAHFVNLSNLEELDLSGNMLTMRINDKWVPPFQLEQLHLGSCKVGPEFPSFLQTQSRLLSVDLSNSSITGVIPTWFWDMSLGYISLAYNNITGNLPTQFQLSKITILNLRSNSIRGPVPSLHGLMTELDLSDNKINGSIPYGICEMPGLQLLDLSNNAISGEIPICWKNNSNLQYIDLSDNKITGVLPYSIGSLQYLTMLQLYNNDLYGEIPSSLQQCKSLIFLSLGKNGFSGIVPSWIGKELQYLVVLQLRSNKFSGFIPPTLGELLNLQILDLAHNSLSGPIPNSVGNLSSMKTSQSYFVPSEGFTEDNYEVSLYIDMNGPHVYTSKPLGFAKTIDMSGNNLTGYIPNEIWMLEGVINLNISRNHLIGQIPETIGGMRSMESLDLSLNNLSGTLPLALSSLSSLHNLNLSYNNFSGEIPTGRQLDTLSIPSIYAGNPDLCGPPTNKSCSTEPVSSSRFRGIDFSHGDNGWEMYLWCFLAIGLGFILGFWSVWGVLIWVDVWKVGYFRMVDRFFDKMYVNIVLAMRRLAWW